MEPDAQSRDLRWYVVQLEPVLVVEVRAESPSAAMLAARHRLDVACDENELDIVSGFISSIREVIVNAPIPRYVRGE